jgi:hypothetical protein
MARPIVGMKGRITRIWSISIIKMLSDRWNIWDIWNPGNLWALYINSSVQ